MCCWVAPTRVWWSWTPRTSPPSSWPVKYVTSHLYTLTNKTRQGWRNLRRFWRTRISSFYQGCLMSRIFISIYLPHPTTDVPKEASPEELAQWRMYLDSLEHEVWRKLGIYCAWRWLPCAISGGNFMRPGEVHTLPPMLSSPPRGRRTGMGCAE